MKFQTLLDTVNFCYSVSHQEIPSLETKMAAVFFKEIKCFLIENSLAFELIIRSHLSAPDANIWDTSMCFYVTLVPSKQFVVLHVNIQWHQLWRHNYQVAKFSITPIPLQGTFITSYAIGFTGPMRSKFYSQ